MKNKLFKSTLAAMAFAVMATGSSVASAGVASAVIGNVGATNVQIGEATTATQVHYRYYQHSHRSHGNSYYGGGQRRNYYEGCRRVKQRYWDGYGYSYRWVRSCH